MNWRAEAMVATGTLLLMAGVAFAADPLTDVKSGVTRLQQAQPAVRQAVVGLQAVPAGWDKTTSKFAQFVSQLATSGGAIDPNALVQYVLRESYLQTTEDLRFFAEKVKYFNQCKKQIREYLQKLRDDDARLKRSGIRYVDLRLADFERDLASLDAQEPELARIQRRLAERSARFEASSPGLRSANVREVLIGLLRESIKEMNEDKQSYLKKLQEANRTADSLSEQLRKLAEASRQLSDEEKKVRSR